MENFHPLSRAAHRDAGREYLAGTASYCEVLERAGPGVPPTGAASEEARQDGLLLLSVFHLHLPTLGPMRTARALAMLPGRSEESLSLES